MSAPNLHEIEWAISQLEQEESSREGYHLLADLYTIRNQMTSNNRQRSAPAQRQTRGIQSEYVASDGGSEFLQAASGKNMADVLDILDEHMEVMRVLNPRAYESVIRKLNRI